ncbi:MAG TPA: hypothetical protein VFQ82_08720 [Stellaceae bacterium]|jgi:hypothetical protein|nr:hypothetical protein [Stellaceae bacterium]
MAGALRPAATLVALLLFAATGARQPGRGAEGPPLSPAQTALFATDHLAAIHESETLDYRFRHDGAKPWDDTVSLAIRAVHKDGSKDVAVAFLSGSRRVELPSVARFHGNPLIMYFLEWDVRQMQQATGGSALYFRTRLRNAFADAAETGTATITLDGRPQPATVVVLEPYKRDPEIARYPSFREKTYRFVLAKAVPGMIYEISTALPSDAEGAPAGGDRVRFVGMHQ